MRSQQKKRKWSALPDYIQSQRKDTSSCWVLLGYAKLDMSNTVNINTVTIKLWMTSVNFKSWNKKKTLCCWQLMPHSIFCLRILFSSSTKFLSEVACPMSLFLFSFCWNVSTRRFLADISPLFESSSSDHQSRGEWKNGKFSFLKFLLYAHNDVFFLLFFVLRFIWWFKS